MTRMGIDPCPAKGGVTALDTAVAHSDNRRRGLHYRGSRTEREWQAGVAGGRFAPDS
jgi:hypothetical protein